MRKYAILCVLAAFLALGAGGRWEGAGHPPPLWPIHIESAHYPVLAASGSIEGIVVIECEVDSSGAVTQARALPGAPDDLAVASQANARRWRFFVPDRSDGAFTVHLQYDYRLTPTATPYDPVTSYSVDLPYHIAISRQRPPMHVLTIFK